MVFNKFMCWNYFCFNIVFCFNDIYVLMKLIGENVGIGFFIKIVDYYCIDVV